MKTSLSTRARSLQAAVGSLFCVALSGQAAAAVVDSAGDHFSVYFNGIVHGTEQAGLTASADFTLTGIDSDAFGTQTWTFDIALNNTSSSPITSSRVSVLGFNLSSGPDFRDSSVSGELDNIGRGHMPLAGWLDLCLKGSDGWRNCAGGGGAGVLQGDSEDLTLSLSFDSELSQLELSDFFVRYQSIGGLSRCQSSGVGVGSEVPVPAAGWLMGTALLGLAGMSRGRGARTAA